MAQMSSQLLLDCDEPLQKKVLVDPHYAIMKHVTGFLFLTGSVQMDETGRLNLQEFRHLWNKIKQWQVGMQGPLCQRVPRLFADS